MGEIYCVSYCRLCVTHNQDQKLHLVLSYHYFVSPWYYFFNFMSMCVSKCGFMHMTVILIVEARRGPPIPLKLGLQL